MWAPGRSYRHGVFGRVGLRLATAGVDAHPEAVARGTGMTDRPVERVEHSEAQPLGTDVTRGALSS